MLFYFWLTIELFIFIISFLCIGYLWYFFKFVAFFLILYLFPFFTFEFFFIYLYWFSFLIEIDLSFSLFFLNALKQYWNVSYIDTKSYPTLSIFTFVFSHMHIQNVLADKALYIFVSNFKLVSMTIYNTRRPNGMMFGKIQFLSIVL